MTDMTTKEMAKELRRICQASWGMARTDSDKLVVIADKLDPPDPKFQEGIWAFCDGELCRLDKPRPDKGDCAWDVKDINDLYKGWANENEFELLSINLADLALAYHARKPLPGYISLKDLPELPEGWEWDVRDDRLLFREPDTGESFWDGEVMEKLVTGDIGAHLIVRRKAQP